MSELLPQLIQQLFNGLSLGAIYALIAIGYTMVYGIIGMINFAHGEIYMIGAYVGLVTLSAIGTQSGLPVYVIIGLMLLVAVVPDGRVWLLWSNRWPTTRAPRPAPGGADLCHRYVHLLAKLGGPGPGCARYGRAVADSRCAALWRRRSV